MRRKVQMLEQQLDGKENERKELADKYVYYYYLTLFSFSWSSQLPSKPFLIYSLAGCLSASQYSTVSDSSC